MRAFGVIMALWGITIALLAFQTWRYNSALAEVQSLTTELDTTRAAQRADRETFQQQIKLIREASRNADKAHKNLADKAGLSDADWLESVLTGMWNKNTVGSETAPGVDAGTVPGAGSTPGTATGENPAAVQRGNDAPRN